MIKKLGHFSSPENVPYDPHRKKHFNVKKHRLNYTTIFWPRCVEVMLPLGQYKKIVLEKKSKMGPKIMSLNGVCICHRLCCVIPEVLKKNKMKISSHITATTFWKKERKTQLRTTCVLRTQCVFILKLYY